MAHHHCASCEIDDDEEDDDQEPLDDGEEEEEEEEDENEDASQDEDLLIDVDEQSFESANQNLYHDIKSTQSNGSTQPSEQFEDPTKLQNAVYQDKLGKLKQKKTVEFEHNLTNMLIHLYNGKQCNEYIKEYKTIVECVSHYYFNL